MKQTDSDLELTVLMPCLDEAETLKICIDKAQAYIKDAGIKGEVLIADNGSTDGSQAIAEKAGARVVAIAQKGYGAALLGGIQSAKGQFIIMGDSDDSYDFSRLQAFVDKLRAGADLVMGNRFKGGIAKGAMPFLHRYLGNPVLSFIGRLFFGIKTGDFHCGLRGFNKDSIQAIGLQATGMEFASEMVVKASLNKLRIEEVPTTLSPDGRSRPPHLRTWRDGWRHLRFLLLFSPRWSLVYPGLLLLILGTVLGVLLLQGPVTLGDIRLDIHTLLYAAISVFLGFQMISFYVLARVYAIRNKLYPANIIDQKLIDLFTFERGLIFGSLLLISGLVISYLAFASWSSQQFGDLEPQQTFRMVLPAALCILLGVQFMLVGFFKSLLEMGGQDTD